MTVLQLPYTKFPAIPSPAFPTQTSVHRPALPLALGYGGAATQFRFLSIIDSGADHCVFPAIYGRQIGINIESGPTVFSNGVAGGSVAYFHNVKVAFAIQGTPYAFDCFAGFMPSMDQLGIGLLGHHGFFALFNRVTFNCAANVVELEPKRIFPPTTSAPPQTP